MFRQILDWGAYLIIQKQFNIKRTSPRGKRIEKKVKRHFFLILVIIH